MVNNERPLGIKPLMIGLVYETQEDDPEERRTVLQADAPSMYAEARLGVASEKEIGDALGKVVGEVKKGRRDLPSLKGWVEEKAEEDSGLELSDLVEAARDKKKSGLLVTEGAVYEKPTNSSQDTLVFRIKGRKTGVDKDTLKLWDVTLSSYGVVGGKVDANFSRSCQCPFTDKHVNKGRLWMDENNRRERKFLEGLIEEELTTRSKEGRKLHLACYHQAAAITALYQQTNEVKNHGIPGLKGKEVEIAFDFTDRWDLVLESFARRYYGGSNYADIDSFLFKHDVVSDYFKGLMEEGKVHREVIKGSRHFSRMGQEIMMRIHRKLLEDGYRYRRFAREFVGVGNRFKDYETTGIVYEKGDLSFHVVYDDTFHIPFVVKKDVSVEEGSYKTSYKRNPVRLLVRNASWREVDDRTGKVAEITVHRPKEKTLEGVRGAESKYKEYLENFKNS